MLTLSVWAFTRCSGFLPHAKNMHIMLVGDRKLPVGEWMGCARCWWPREGVFLSFTRWAKRSSSEMVFLLPVLVIFLLWSLAFSHMCKTDSLLSSSWWNGSNFLSRSRKRICFVDEVTYWHHLQARKTFDPPRCRNIRVLGPSNFIMQPM